MIWCAPVLPSRLADRMDEMLRCCILICFSFLRCVSNAVSLFEKWSGDQPPHGEAIQMNPG